MSGWVAAKSRNEREMREEREGRTELFGVFTADGSSVDDSGLVSYLLGNLGSEEGSNVGVSVLRLYK